MKKRPAQHTTESAVLAVALAAAVGGSAPEWIQLFPASSGAIVAGDGRRWTLDDAAAVIQASMASGRPLAIDYDHAIDLAAKHGQRAPAAGWITDLDVRDDGIYGRVEWTEEGGRAVAAREYRYISPVFTAKKQGSVVRILRASLTNDPAFDTMRALAKHDANHQEDSEMDELLKALCAALGLDPEKTDNDAVVTAVTALQDQAKTDGDRLKALCAKLELKADASQEEIETALASRSAASAGTPDPDKYVPIAVVRNMQTELAQLKGTVVEDKATAAVEEAIKDGRLAPANKEWAVNYAKKDLAAFKEFVGRQPQIVGDRVAPPGEADAAGTLTAEEKALCRNMGITEENYLATKKARAQETQSEEVI